MRNYSKIYRIRLRSGSFFNKNCSWKVFWKLHWLQKDISYSAAIQDYSINNNIQKHKRNIFSISAHKFHFSEILYNIIPQNNTLCEISSYIHDFPTHNCHFSDFFCHFGPQNPASQKKHVHIFVSSIHDNYKQLKEFQRVK